MFSHEERTKAVELYLKYESWAAVISELGYPNRSTLRNWVKEYQENESLHKKQTRKEKYSEEEKSLAVNYYLEHGKNISKTLRALGYPSRNYLKQWILERCPDSFRTCATHKSLVHLSVDKKEKAVIEFCERRIPATKIAQKYKINRTSLYNWKKELLGDKDVPKMPKKKVISDVQELKNEINNLTAQADDLRQQIYRLQLEKDVLEKAAEIIKKDQGITLQTLTNREKAIVIDTLRNKYSLKELLSVFHMAKSSYCYQENAINSPDKYEEHRELVRQSFSASHCSYGYRRIYLDLKDAGMTISEKVIRRLMKEESLSVKSVRRKNYNSYMGEISPSVDNLLKRDFHAEQPNQKWLTDITEFHIPAGKIYLSPIIDCFDGLPVSWTVGIHPDAELVNNMLDTAISTLKEGETPIVHSDRGAHYRWPGWIERMNRAGLTRSMSKKGCSPDNSACEGFFGRLKNEMFYNRSWKDVSIDDFIAILNDYIKWYAEKRRKISLNGMSPLQYRKSMGYT